MPVETMDPQEVQEQPTDSALKLVELRTQYADLIKKIQAGKATSEESMKAADLDTQIHQLEKAAKPPRREKAKGKTVVTPDRAPKAVTAKKKRIRGYQPEDDNPLQDAVEPKKHASEIIEDTVDGRYNADDLNLLEESLKPSLSNSNLLIQERSHAIQKELQSIGDLPQEELVGKIQGYYAFIYAAGEWEAATKDVDAMSPELARGSDGDWNKFDGLARQLRRLGRSFESGSPDELKTEIERITKELEPYRDAWHAAHERRNGAPEPHPDATAEPAAEISPIVSPEARAQINRILDEIKKISAGLPDAARADTRFPDVSILSEIIQRNLDFINDPASSATPERLAQRVRQLRDTLNQATKAFERHVPLATSPGTASDAPPSAAPDSAPPAGRGPRRDAAPVAAAEIPPLTDSERRSMEVLHHDREGILSHPRPSLASVLKRMTDLGPRIDEIESLPSDQRALRIIECNTILDAAYTFRTSERFLCSCDNVFALETRRKDMSADDFQIELGKLGVNGDDELKKLHEAKAILDGLLPRFDTASPEELRDAMSSWNPGALKLLQTIDDRRRPIISPTARAEIRAILEELSEISAKLPAGERLKLQETIERNLRVIEDNLSRETPENHVRRINELKRLLSAASPDAGASAAEPTAGVEPTLDADPAVPAALDAGSGTGPDLEPDGDYSDPLDSIGSDADAAATDAKEKMAEVLSRFEEGLTTSPELEAFFDGLTFDSLNNLPDLEAKFKTVFSFDLLAALGVDEGFKDAVIGRYWGMFLESVTDRVRFAVAQMEQQSRLKKEGKYALKAFGAGATYAGARVLLDMTGLSLAATAAGGIVGGAVAGLAWITGRTAGVKEKELGTLLEKLNTADDNSKAGIVESLKEDITAIMATDQNRAEKLDEMERYLLLLERAGTGPGAAFNYREIVNLRHMIGLTRSAQQNPTERARSDRLVFIKGLLSDGTISKWASHYAGDFVMQKALVAFQTEAGREATDSEVTLLEQHVALAAERDMNALLGDVVAQEQAEIMQGSEHYLQTYTDKFLGREHPETFVQAVLVGVSAGAVTGALSSSAMASGGYMFIRRGEAALRSEILGRTREVKTAHDVEHDLDGLLQNTNALSETSYTMDARELDQQIRAAIEDARTRVKLPDMKEADRARIERRIAELQNAWIRKSVLLNIRVSERVWEEKLGGYVTSVDKAQEMAKKEKASKRWFSKSGLIQRGWGLSKEDKWKAVGAALFRAGESAAFGALGGAAVGAGAAQYEDQSSFFHRLIGDQKDVVGSEPGSAPARGVAESGTAARGAAPRDSGATGPEASPPNLALADAYDKGFDKLGFTDVTRAQFAQANPGVAAEMADDPHQLDVAHDVLTHTNLPDDQIDDIVMAHPEVLASPDSVSELMAKLETAGVAPDVAATMLAGSHDNLAKLTPAEQHDFIESAVLNTHPGFKDAGYKVSVDDAGKVTVSIELGKDGVLGNLEHVFAQLAAEGMVPADMLDEDGALTEMAAAKLLNVANNLNELLEKRGMESFRDSFNRAGVSVENGTVTIKDFNAFGETLQDLLAHAEEIKDTLMHGAVASIDDPSQSTWSKIVSLQRAAGHNVVIPDYDKSAVVTNAEHEVGTAMARSGFGAEAEDIQVIDEETATFTHHGVPVEIHGGHITSYDSIPIDIDPSGGEEAVGEGIFSAQVAHEIAGLDADSESMEELARELHGSREPLTADDRSAIHTMAENHISADDVREGGEIQRPLVELVAREHLTSEQVGVVRDTHELMSEHLEANIPYENIKGMVLDHGWTVEHPDGVEGVVVANPAQHNAMHLSPQPGDTVRATYLPEYASGTAYDESQEVMSPLTHEPIARDVKESGVHESSLKAAMQEIPAQASRETGVVDTIAEAAKDHAIFDKFARDLKPDEVDTLLTVPAGAFNLDQEGASQAEVDRVASAVGTNQTDDVREVVRAIKSELGRMEWHHDDDPIRDVLQFKIEQDVHVPTESPAVEASPEPAPEAAPVEAAPPAPETPPEAPAETPASKTETATPEPEASSVDRGHAYALLQESLKDEDDNPLSGGEISLIIQNGDSDARAALSVDVELMLNQTRNDSSYGENAEMQSTARGLENILSLLRDHEAAAAAPTEQSVAIPGGKVEFEYGADGRVNAVRPDATHSGPLESLNDNYRATVIEHLAAASEGGPRSVDLDITKLEDDAREVDLYREALSALENKGQGDSPEASFLHRQIDEKILRLEDKYGDVFKE